MALSDAAYASFMLQGVSMVEDLSELEDNDIDDLIKLVRRDDVNPQVVGVNSQIRLKAASSIVRYYALVGRETTAANMQWTMTIRNFKPGWKALKEAKANNSEPDVPKISRNLTATAWVPAFTEFLNRIVGSRQVPLSYVIRSDADVLLIAPPLRANYPYSEEHGGLQEELIARATHDHPLFSFDNARVFSYLEEATRGTVPGASMKGYIRRKNGRGAFMAIVEQHAGEDKIKTQLKEKQHFLLNRRYTGKNNQLLEKFINQHRTAYTRLEECSERVDFQLPNGRTRVQYLLDAISCSFPPLQAAMAYINNDKLPDGPRQDFEAAASTLSPHCPVRNNPNYRSNAGGTGSGRGGDANANVSSLKVGFGPSGVELRFYSPGEYAKLNEAEKKDLNDHRDHRESQGLGRQLPRKRPAGQDKNGKGGSAKKQKGIAQEQVSAAVAKELKDRAKSAEKDNKRESDFQLAVSAAVARHLQSPGEPLVTPVSATASSASIVSPTADSRLNAMLQTPVLQSILKKSKRSSFKTTGS